MPTIVTDKDLANAQQKMHSDLDKMAKVIGGKVITPLKSTDDSLTSTEESYVKAEYTPPRPEVTVTEEDKRAFIRSLLSGERFFKTYKLFGDALQVTFKSRKVSENKLVGDTSYGDGKASERKRMVISIESMSLIPDDNGVIKTLKGVEFIENDVIKETEFTDGLCDIVFYAILEAFRQFEDICDAMFKRANDYPFWKGTDGEA